MTTYTGKDVTIKLGGTTITKLQEFSFEVDNGQIDVKEISSAIVAEFAWTKIATSGSMTIRPESTGTYSVSALMALVLPSNALPTTQPTDDITIEYGATPDFTATLTAVSFGSVSCSIGIEEPVDFEIPYTAKTFTIA